MTISEFIRLNKEVLGVNKRNEDFIRPLNPRSAKIIADNKIITKRVLAKVGINSAELYKVVRTRKQLQFLDWDSLPKSFVLKPNQGTGGNGIIVFYGKKKGKYEWIRPNGTTMTKGDIILHIENILDGRFSMGNRRDVAIIEERIKTDSTLKPYTYKGVPDVRVIVFNRIPVMAMLRLPTKRSNGTANLHSGAICVGIDIASGITRAGMYLKKSPIIEDTYTNTDTTLDLENNLPLIGLQIPFWNDILDIAVKSQEVSGLGYLGADIAIDRDKGPLVIEINARPGLGIQVANKIGLKKRLEQVKEIEIKSMKHGIRVAKNLFGGEVEEEIESISGKTVVNLIEKVTLFYKSDTDETVSKKKVERNKEIVKAMLDTGITTSRIDWGIASRLGFYKALDFFKKSNVPDTFPTLKDAQMFIDTIGSETLQHKDILRLAKVSDETGLHVLPVVEIEIRIAGETKKVEMVVSSQKAMIYPLLIGRKELNNYLIDTSKTFTK
ncbi:MAG: Alpha-L-glutamate ligase-related protein [candidate division WS6 bacterium GW2011_GWF2_39_15]|uniref:Alpha-L-glutamate ligase-related protein n=1 Tax=candidate division WS6 bacterium GW2011_GWF2_39_15 TaxID=1619100 RepID=A0A0G0N0M7_9BACT|nr:MAG: Alpha-L-glutamate ligase-related protein [candidate division WS6 bacterium GW2011_GWF2_39_15]